MVVAFQKGPPNTRLWGEVRRSQTAGSPLIGRASPELACAAASKLSGPHDPDPGQRDTVLNAVKDGLETLGRAGRFARRPSLTASARGVTGAAHGRDEETVLQSN